MFGVAAAMAANPAAVDAMLKADWEIASHGYRWIDYQYVPEAVEREHIAKAIALHAELTGARPLGLVSGAYLSEHGAAGGGGRRLSL